ncbi:MAG: hypothetical protein ACM31H_00635 [Nitrososphaerales archaeon]
MYNITDQDYQDAIKQAIEYNVLGTRSETIRRAAVYLKWNFGKKQIKCYYDNENYPNWRGGFIKTGLKDFRSKTYGIIEKIIWDNKQHAIVLWKLRTLVKPYFVNKKTN